MLFPSFASGSLHGTVGVTTYLYLHTFPCFAMDMKCFGGSLAAVVTLRDIFRLISTPSPVLLPPPRFSSLWFDRRAR